MYGCQMDGKTGFEEDANRVGRDINRLGWWAKSWQMECNMGKCEVVHFGKENKHII